jgi:hypothetical protein
MVKKAVQKKVTKMTHFTHFYHFLALFGTPFLAKYFNCVLFQGQKCAYFGDLEKRGKKRVKKSDFL